MPDLVDVARGGGEEPELPEYLDQFRVGKASAYFIAFTSDVETVEMHWVEAPGVNTYVLCPGDGCPACYVDGDPKRFHLMPVVNIRRRKVEVLRIPESRDAGSLLSQLVPYLRGDTTSQLFSVHKADQYRFVLTASPLSEDADRCRSVIDGFLQARDDGLSLTVAFQQYTALELAEFPSIRSVLDARGGWTPPTPTPDDAQTGE